MRILPAILLLCAGIPGFAQEPTCTGSAGDFANAFVKALQQNDIASFIKNNSLTDQQFLELALEERKQRAAELAEEEEDMASDASSEEATQEEEPQLTLEQAAGYMAAMKESLTAGFNYGIKAAEAVGQVDWKKVSLTLCKATESYWQPPTVEIAMMLKSGDTSLVVTVDNLNKVGDKIVLGPGSRVTMQGYEVPDVIAHHIIQALRTQDPDYYINHVLATKENFKRLLDAAYKDNPGVAGSMDLDQGYQAIKENLKKDFEKLLATGKEAGIDWSKIEKTWSGYSAHLQGEIYQSSIPFQFRHATDEYRVVLDFCTQHKTFRDIFQPGQFQWEGKTSR